MRTAVWLPLALVAIFAVAVSISVLHSIYSLTYSEQVYSLYPPFISPPWPLPVDAPHPPKSPQRPPGMAVVPKIIHQTFKTRKVPQRWLEPFNSCQALHPVDQGWTHMFWTDASSRHFIDDHYPWFTPTYSAYPYNIQRVDAIRYFALYHFGGIYLDLDMGCRKSLDSLRNNSLIFPKTSPIGFSNDVFLASKNHPFLMRLIQELPSWTGTFLLGNTWGTKYPTVMLSTGPLFASIILARWSWETNRTPATGGIFSILPPALYSNGPDQYFRMFSGSSWHGSDAKFITYLGDLLQDHTTSFLFVIVLIVLLLVLSCIKLGNFFRRRFRRKANSLPFYSPMAA